MYGASRAGSPRDASARQSPSAADRSPHPESPRAPRSGGFRGRHPDLRLESQQSAPPLVEEDGERLRRRRAGPGDGVALRPSSSSWTSSGRGAGSIIRVNGASGAPRSGYDVGLARSYTTAVPRALLACRRRAARQQVRERRRRSGGAPQTSRSVCSTSRRMTSGTES